MSFSLNVTTVDYFILACPNHSFDSSKSSYFFSIGTTLESRIDIGQGISVGHGRFGKKNKRRAWKIGNENSQQNTLKTENIRSPWNEVQNFINLGPGKRCNINKRRAYVYSGL